MLNYIWAGMLLTGFAVGIINGRLEEVTQAAFASAGKAVELCIGLLGVMCLWSGLMKVMENCGLIRLLARFASPVMGLLFPKLSRDKKAQGAIVMNLAANFMGLGNAATPLGIRAMEELQRANAGSDTASDSMCMFLVLNTSAIQLIPATVIAIRMDAGSAAPSEIMACVWFASACATLAGVAAVRLLSRYGRRRKLLLRGGSLL